MNILEVKNLSKTFGGIHAISNVSFHLQKNDATGIIGPNGAGKTTLFNLISGVIKPDFGKIFLKGEEITNKESYEVCRKGLTRTFQICRPFRRLSVQHNVLVGALKATSSLKEAYEKTYEILNFIGLYSKSNLLAEKLNIVDLKKLELARAYATQPEVLLLDEVMSGLNPKELSDVIVTVKQILQKGITIVLIEHVLKAVMSICNKVIVLNYGVNLAEGGPNDVIRNPKVIEAYLGEKRSHALS